MDLMNRIFLNYLNSLAIVFIENILESLMNGGEHKDHFSVVV